MTTPDYTNPEVFLNDELIFSVVHNNVFSITNMNDKELRQSIIDDILTVTMWEKENNQKVHFGFTKFLQWIPRYLHKRVFKEIQNEEIIGLIEIKDREIRIKDQREILQAAMDYCGHWWENFDIPKDALVFSKENLEKMVEEAGGIEALATELANEIISEQIDKQSNAKGTTTLQ